MAKKTFSDYARATGELAGKVLAGAFILVFGLGFFIQSVEAIPDNAKVVAIHEYKTLLPLNDVWRDYATRPETEESRREYSIITYGETLQKAGPYSDYKFSESNINNGVTTGASAPILLYPFLKRRWTKDGAWNW